LLLIPPTLLMVTGLDPLRLTLATIVLTVIALPFIAFPLLVILNDPHYLKRRTNGRLGNALVVLVILGGAVMAIIALPLVIPGGR